MPGLYPASGWPQDPALSKGSDAQDGQASEVHGGGEQGEVGRNLGLASHAGATSAVQAAEQVRQLTFHFGPRGA